MANKELELSLRLITLFTGSENDWKWKSMDPFASLTTKISETLASDEELSCFYEQIIDSVRRDTPTTSAPCEVPADDGRIVYGYQLGAVFTKLGQILTSLRETNEDESTILSLQDIKLISSTFQFYLLSAVLPYIEEGVGIPIQARSVYIKAWKRLTDDIGFQRRMLQSSCQVIENLILSNGAIRGEFLSKYLTDIIAAFEQLKQLKVDADYAHLLSKIPPQFLIANYITLMRRVGQNPIPTWFMTAIGSHLSTIICGDNGVSRMVHAYLDISHGSFWQNTPFLMAFANLLARTPQCKKKSEYFESIIRQFFELCYSDNEAANYAILFGLFVDEMCKKKTNGFGFLIVDRIFNPIVRLCECGDMAKWTIEVSKVIRMLSFWSDANKCPASVANDARIVQLIPVLLRLLAAQDMQFYTERPLFHDIKKICSFALKKLANKAELLSEFIVGRSNDVKIVIKKKLISVVSDDRGKENLYGDVEIRKSSGNDEEALARRIEIVIELVKTDTNCLIELACASVTRYYSTTSDDEALATRFVDIVTEECDPEWQRTSAHLLAGVVFEQLADLEDVDNEVVRPLTKLIETILRATREVIISDAIRKTNFDVVGRTSAKEELQKEILETAVQNAKMAVGLSGAVIMKAKLEDEILCEIQSMLGEMKSFVVSLADCTNVEITAVRAEAEMLLSLFEDGDVKISPAAASTTKASTSKPVDLIESLRMELNSELVPERGHALVVVSNLILKRNRRVTEALHLWLYEKIKQLIADHDSYVFLAAINALAECACYKTDYLKDLFQTFRKYSALQDTSSVKPAESEECSSSDGADKMEDDSTRDDTILIIRGKLAEVIGKVFRYMGDIAPFWLEEAVCLLLPCLRDNSDIMRASALSALSDLVLSCRGVGIQKYVVELLHLVQQILTLEKSELVRRASVHLLRQFIRSSDAAIFEIIGTELRDLRRALMHLWRYDADHVVRLHAELCLEEMRECLKANMELEQSQYGVRRIAMM